MPLTQLLFTVLTCGFVTQDDPTSQARALVEKLRSEKVEERDEASRRLKELGEVALPELEKAAKDKDPEVAGRANFLLRAIAIEEIVTPALRNLMPDAIERLLAKDEAACKKTLLEAADQQKHPGLTGRDLEPLATPALRGAKLETTNCFGACKNHWCCRAGEKGDVCAAIVMFSLRSAVPEIMKLLASPIEGGRLLALETLARLRAREAAAEIVGLLAEDEQWDECRGCRAAQVLGEFQADGIVGDVCELLAAPNAGARLHATYALGLLGARQATTLVRARLKDANATVRREAVATLARLKATEATADLKALLRDKDRWVRYQAARALADLHASESLPEILELLSDRESLVRSGAVDAVGQLGSRWVAPRIEVLLEDVDFSVRESAARTLGILGAAESVPIILRLLRDEFESVRRESVKAVRELGADRQIGQVVKLFQEDRTDVWTSAGEILIAQRPEYVVRECLDLLGERDSTARRRAVQLFTKLSREKIVPLLGASLRSMDPGLRASIADALCQLGSREGVAVLLDTTGQSRTRLSSLNALRRPDLWRRIDTGWPLMKHRRGGLMWTEEREIPIVSVAAPPQGLCSSVADWCGLKLEISGSVRDGLCEEGRGQQTIRNCHGWTRLVDSLEEALGPNEFILEDGWLRIVTPQEATRFWRQWDAEQESRK